MKSSRYVSQDAYPVATRTQSRDEPKHSPTCEIPGCKTHFVPASNGYPNRYECGKTVTLVNDHRGDKRGICSVHYLQGLVAAGKHPNQNLVDADGRYDARKVHDHWDSMAQQEIEQTRKLTRRTEIDP